MINRQNLRSDLEKVLANLPGLTDADIKNLMHDIEYVIEWHAPEIFPGPAEYIESEIGKLIMLDPSDDSKH